MFESNGCLKNIMSKIVKTIGKNQFTMSLDI